MKRVCDNCKGLINDDKDAIRVNYLTWMDLGGLTYSFMPTHDTFKEVIICQDCYDYRIKYGWR